MAMLKFDIAFTTLLIEMKGAKTPRNAANPTRMERKSTVRFNTAILKIKITSIILALHFQQKQTHFLF